MFSRLFNINNKKDSKKVDDWKKELDGFQAPPGLPNLDRSNIRVLIYKETSSKKNLLFDSGALVLVEDQPSPSPGGDKVEKNEKNGKNKKQCPTPVAPLLSPPKYKILKVKADVSMLGEMIFGNLAMVYKGSIVKVHLIRTPPQLMMTKVFALRSRSAGVNFCDSEMLSCGSYSKPVNVSTPSLLNDSTSSGSPIESMSRSYSTPIGIRGEPSSLRDLRPSLLQVPSWSTPNLDSISLCSSISLNTSPMNSYTGSFLHRFNRSKRTSLDSSQLWRSKSEQSEELRTVYKQQPKIGIGIIFNLWDNHEDNRAFQNFFFTHYTLFEAHLQALRVKIEKSFYLRQKFLDASVDAVECFKEDIFRLCYAPRIIEPVWLNVTSTVENKQRVSSEHFIRSFLDLYGVCENKETSYFMSNLLTSVLTHHLSWVNTVQLSNDRNAQKLHLDKYSSSAFNVLAKCHPYNPLWAQICDLYGCLGSPLKLARTVIVGKNVGLVKQILEFVSYFIRCCEVEENSVRMEKPQKDLLCSRLSDSNWIDTLSVGSQNSHIQSWFERSCNIISAPSNNNAHHNKESGNVDYFKDFKSYSHLDSLKEESEQQENHHDISSTDIMKILKSVNCDSTKCHCSLLQALNNFNDKKLKSYVKMDGGMKTLGSSKAAGKTSQKSPDEGLKCCVLCRTLEKGISEEFCENCKLQLGNVSLDVSLVCLHCVKRMDRLKNRLLGTSNIDENSIYPIRTSRSESNKIEKNVGQNKPSFICYCCSPSTYGDVKLEVHVDTTLEGSLDDLNPVISRPRNTSDPVDFIVKSENNFSNLRNSTNSHDSGTEMEYCSSGACDNLSDCCTRTNSLSSHGVAPDLDSDYCSVENEQLASTLTTEMTLAPGYLAIYSQDAFANCVMKSSSTSTLKAPTIISTDGSATIGDDDDLSDINERTDVNVDATDNLELDHKQEELLDELKSLKLSEIALPKSVTRQPRKCTKYPDAPSIGKSMFAGYSEEYMPNFVLQGCRNLDKNKLASELQKTVKYSVLDEEIADAVCIVADTDTWTCEVWGISRRMDSINQNTCESLTSESVYASDLVSSMVESTKDMCSLNMPANFCLLHIEEQLRDLYNRSKVFSEYSQHCDDAVMCTFMRGFGYHRNDIDLLTAVGDAFVVPVAADVSSTY